MVDCFYFLTDVFLNLDIKEFAVFVVATILAACEELDLRILIANLSNQEIAEQFLISPGVLKSHHGNYNRKLGVNYRTRTFTRAPLLSLVLVIF